MLDLLLYSRSFLLTKMCSFVVLFSTVKKNVYFVLQTYLPNVKVHAYFAPVTPPPSVGGGRRRFCRCCAIV